MGRDLHNFKGKNAVVACGEGVVSCKAKLHPKNDYFSININPETSPDLVHDITKELPPIYQNEFHITLIERLDFYVYNKDVHGTFSNRNQEAIRSLVNLLKKNYFSIN